MKVTIEIYIYVNVHCSLLKVIQLFKGFAQVAT